MAGEPTVTMRVWRGETGSGAFQEYRVPLQDGMVVLDVIHRIQATQAPDLACRWNCKAGKCGSCSAEIDGTPALMCMTRMDRFAPGATVTVAPMRTFPLYRDLATDVSFNYEKARTMPAVRLQPQDFDGKRRIFVVEFAGTGRTTDDLKIDAATSSGKLSNLVLQPNPLTKGVRASFELAPGDNDVAELRLRLLREGKPISETWLYRWTAS